MARGTSASARCVVASATRRPPPTSIITTCGARALGEILGMAGEHDARIVDHAFLHRRGHHGVELAAQAAVDRAIEDLEHVAAVGGVGLSRRSRPAQRNMLELREIDERPVADRHDAGREALGGEHAAELRADARRLTGGEGDDRAPRDDRPYRSSSLSST